MYVLAETGIVPWLSLGVSILTALGVLWLQRSMQKYDRLEDTSRATIDEMKKASERKVSELQTGLHEVVGKLVDERFRGMTHQIQNSVNAFEMTMTDFKERLKDGEIAFDGLTEKDYAVEQKVLARLDELKDYVRDHAATRDDLKEHEKTVARKFDHMGEQVNEMGQKLAVLSDRVGIGASRQ
jgi:DNA repair ATPase RecN